MQRVVVMCGDTMLQTEPRTRNVKPTKENGWNLKRELNEQELEEATCGGILLTAYELQQLLNEGWNVILMSQYTENVAEAARGQANDHYSKRGAYGIMLILEKDMPEKKTKAK